MAILDISRICTPTSSGYSQGALPPTTPITQCGLIPLRTEAISILAVNRELLCTPPQCHSRKDDDGAHPSLGTPPPVGSLRVLVRASALATGSTVTPLESPGPGRRSK